MSEAGVLLAEEKREPNRGATTPRSIGVRAASIKIRLAESEQDIEKLVALGARLLEESRYRELRYSPDKLRQAGRRALANKGQYGVLMAMKGDEVVGFLVATISEYFFSDELAATTIFFYVVPERRGSLAAIKLLHGFRNWARNRKVREIHINVTTGIHIAKTDKLMKRVGFRFTGGNYATIL